MARDLELAHRFIARSLPARRGLSAALAASLLAAAPAALSAAAPGLRATTARYVFTLRFGMPEQMWTRAQVAKMRPKTGELILAGDMSGGMPMGDAQRDLEVHIYARATGLPVAGAHPAITLRDLSVANAKAVAVPVAETEGIAAGPADLHYGNNVTVVGGDRYLVTVVLNGTRVLLEASAPT